MPFTEAQKAEIRPLLEELFGLLDSYDAGEIYGPEELKTIETNFERSVEILCEAGAYEDPTLHDYGASLEWAIHDFKHVVRANNSDNLYNNLGDWLHRL